MLIMNGFPVFIRNLVNKLYYNFIKVNEKNPFFTFQTRIYSKLSVKEINRVLVPGGYGFIHHSWLYGGQEESFKNIAGRSNMTPERFKELVEENGMEIVSQKEFQFPTVTDCISFFKKKD